MGSQPKRNSSRRWSALWALGFVPLALGNASGASLSELRQRDTEATARISEQNQVIAATLQRLEAQSTEIEKLKARQRKDASFLRNYRLQTSLKKAQELSSEIEKLKEERDRGIAQHRPIRRELLQALDRAIDEGRVAASNKHSPTASRRRAASDLEALLLERMRLAVADTGGGFGTDASSLFDPAKDPEETEARRAAIGDFERRMTEELTSLRRELAEARKQRFLRAEVAHLFEEESFFSEQGFVRVGKKDADAAATTTAPLMGAKAGTATGPAGTDPTASGPSAASTAGPAPANIAPPPPATGENVVAIPPSPSTSEVLSAPTVGAETTLAPSRDPGLLNPTSTGQEFSTPRSEGRDPIAQLASQLGVSSLSGPASDRNVDQVSWLETRIALMEKILVRLHEKAKSLEPLPVK